MKGVFFFILYQFIISIINVFIFRKPKSYEPKKYPKVSVLIPARNEEKTIEKCLNSLLSQDYPLFEVIIFNDASSDRTYEILKSIRNEKLKIINSVGTLEEGWTGKNWACYQLYLASSGEILIFTDADTSHKKGSIFKMVQEMERKNLDFITGIPKEETMTFGEKITVPFINFSVFSIFPIFLSYLSRFFYFFMFGNGQFMMFRREAYEKIQGHKAVQDKIAEDIELSKTARKYGLKVGIYDLTDVVSCRMYRNFKEAFLGLSKSYFPLFQMKLIPSIFVWVWVLIITFGPFYVLLFYKDPYMKLFATISIFETLIIWLIASIKFKLPKEIPFYYPLISLINSIIGFSSIILGIMGKSSWKGRTFNRRKIRLL